MEFNLNEFLLALSFALDFVEMDLFGVVTNHSKRVAYISMKLAENMGLSKQEIFDMVSLAILHDNGISERNLHNEFNKNITDIQRFELKQEHGIKGEENIKHYPFMTDVKNVISYHHENYDGSGFFNIKGDEIPIMSQIIKLADTIELSAPLNGMYIEDKLKLQELVKNGEGTLYAPSLIKAYLDISQKAHFWLDMKDEFISASLQRYMPNFTMNLPISRVNDITRVFTKIIDGKSKFTHMHSKGLSEKADIMGRFYNKSEEEIYKLRIAANLHDIGKLAVSNSILDKPGKLDNREFDIIQQHTYFTRISLQGINGFEEITEWASNHHEKLNGLGYPFRKTGDMLDFNSKLICCLDIYQALMEERPYREPMKHEKAAQIMREMVNKNEIDKNITNDIIRLGNDKQL